MLKLNATIEQSKFYLKESLPHFLKEMIDNTLLEVEFERVFSFPKEKIKLNVIILVIYTVISY